MPTQKITRSNLPGALKAHAIIIAINRYDNIGAHLRTPILDGKALQEVLINYQGFAEENVHTCYDPTKAELEDFFATIQQEGSIKPQDGILFYYAGHGLAGDVDGVGAAGYLMPSDVSFSMAELSKNDTLVKMEWVFKQLDAFDCHHTLAIMDCCFAGAFRRMSLTRASMGLGLRPMSQERFKRYQEKRAWQVLASAGPAEKAADLISERGETTKNSPFAEALVDALSGKARPDFKPPGKNLGDGVLTTHELFIYLHDEVERRTRKSTAFKPQNPDLFPMGRHDGGQFIFCDPRHPQNQPNWDQRKRKNPYKGLEQYDLADADYYFGRSSDVEKLRAIMQLLPGAEVTEEQIIPSLLLVSGPSGSGKSSLVKAGLLPAFLEKGYDVFQFRPSDRPWSLSQFADNKWTEVLQVESGPFTFLPRGKSSPVKKTQLAASQSFYLDSQSKQVLYIDQAEELFTSCSPAEQTVLNTYLKEVLAAAMKGQLRIVLSMRSDFEWQLELSEFGQQFWDIDNDAFALYRIRSLGLDDLRAVLVNPATLFAYEFEKKKEKDLVDVILQDLNYLTNALPLLSYTMQEMVKQTSQSERLFKFSTYREKVGGVSGALSKRMQAIYDSFGPESPLGAVKEIIATPKQELLRHLFLRMVGLSDGDYVRRRVYRDRTLDELAFKTDNSEIEDILNTLRKDDIISTGGEAGVRYEELIHDSLINTWTTGKQWINEFGKENLNLQRELWKSVLDHAAADSSLSAEIPTSTHTPSLAISHSSAHYLWDASPKLLQVLKQVADNSLFLLNAKEKIDLNNLPGQVKFDEAAFMVFWETCCRKQEFPDWNTLLLSDHSEVLLQVLLRNGKHGLNQAEAAFVAESWHVRIKDILTLKKERDEARSIALATKARQLEPQNPTVALNLAAAASKMYFNEESYSAFVKVLENENRSFYQNQFICPVDNAALKFSPNGQYVLVKDTETTIKIWCFQEGEYTSFSCDFGYYQKVAFSPDGQFVLLVAEGKLYRWELDKNALIPWEIPASNITCVDVFLMGQKIATGHEDQVVRLWDFAGKELKTYQPSAEDETMEEEMGYSQRAIRYVIFSPDGQQLLTGCENHIVRLHNLSDDAVTTLSNTGRGITELAFSPDGRLVWLVDSNFLLSSWKLSGEAIELFPEQAEENCWKLVFSPDSQLFIRIDSSGIATLWNTAGEEILHLSEQVGEIFSAAFFPESQLILTGNGNNTASLFNLSGQVLKTFAGHTNQVKQVAFSPDRRTIITGSEEVIKWWNLDHNLRKHLLEIPYPKEEQGADYGHTEIGCFALSPLKSAVVFGFKHDKFELPIIDFSGNVLKKIAVREDKWLEVVYAADGKSLLAGSADANAYLRRSDGKLLKIFQGHQDKVLSVAISSDSRLMLTGSSDHTVKLWNPKGELLTTFSGHTDEIKSVAFSPDHQFILTGSFDNTAKLWDLSGKELCTFSGHERRVHSVAFAPDGRSVLTGGSDNNARLWSLEGELLTTFTGHDKSVIAGVFSQDGQLILTGSLDNTAKLWSLEGEMLETITTGSDWVRLVSVAFSSKDEFIAICTQKTVRLRRNFYADLKSAAIWEKNYQFTPDEQAKYKISWEY